MDASNPRPGQRDRMQYEIERAVGLLSQVEHASHVVVVLDVARRDQPRADRIGQLADASFHLVAGQVGETNLRPLRQELLAIAQAMLKSFATPRITPFFPEKSPIPGPLRLWCTKKVVLFIRAWTSAL